MRIAVQVELKADRREPLGALVRRVAAQFQQEAIQPTIVAFFTDSPGGTTTSAVDRALKKYPHLAAFERKDSPVPGMPSIRGLTNPDVQHTFEIKDLLALADGVPRSLPFHTIAIQFRHAEFGQAVPNASPAAPSLGVTIHDSWWVNGRKRTLTALYSVDVDAACDKLPDPPRAVRAILVGFGKPRKSRQFILKPSNAAAPNETGASTVASDRTAIAPIVAKHRGGLRSLIERLGLPHDLPPENQARQINRGASGPLKPTLVNVFGPRGFDCHGGSGIFTLQRRTTGNHVAELKLDVGTWSRSVTAIFRVRGPGFNAALELPITVRAQGHQYPIGDVENWQRIVGNLATIVDELERTFVKEIEAAVGRAPDWFNPGRN
jgi:hypothetical protein